MALNWGPIFLEGWGNGEVARLDRDDPRMSEYEKDHDYALYVFGNHWFLNSGAFPLRQSNGIESGKRDAEAWLNS